MRLFILAVLFLFSSGLMSAQDAAETRYRLHRPSAADYLTLIADYAAGIPDSWRTPLETEITADYPDLSDQDYPLIERAYQALLSGVPYDIPFLDYNYWITNSVRSWLRANPTDLSGMAELTIGDGVIEVLPVDFDGDGRDEYALHYISAIAEGFLFLKASENDAGYTIIPSPLRFETRALEDPNPYDGDDIIPLYFSHMATGDFTQDGHADLALLYDRFIEGDFSDFSEQRVYILSLADASLLDVGDSTLSFNYQSRPPVWEVVETDQESGMVIQQSREMRDNWHCEYTRTTIYSWNGTAFTKSDHQDTFPDAAPCYLRFAEEAMWDYRYDEAIDLYQRYLTTGYADEYVRVRLAVALIMSDQIDAGIDLLNTLKTDLEGDRGQSLAPMVNQMLNAYTRNPAKIAVCLAAYDYIARNPNAVWFSETLEVGRTEENMIYERGMHSPGIPSPDRAGCEFPKLLDELLEQTTFVTAVSPIEQFARVGLFIDSSFHADLNEDGIDDWLVWMPTIYLSPLFFLSDQDLYHVSSAYVTRGDSLNAQNTLTTIRLPDEAGLGLLNVDYSDPFTVVPLGFGLSPEVGVCEADGEVNISRLMGDKLTTILSARLCEAVNPSQVVDNLNLVQEIYAWNFADMVENNYTPITYRWDSASQTFVIPPTFQMTLTPQPTVTPQPGSEALPANPNTLRWTDPADLYRDGEYAQIIALRDEALASPDIHPERVLAWHYMTARAYEALGHDDEALAEYIALHEMETASEVRTAWVLLAGLHLEPITD